MLVSTRTARWASRSGFVPQRRRAIVLGATEAGIAAAFHLGEQAMLLEQRGEKVTGNMAAALTGFMKSELRLAARVVAVHVSERRLELATGESFVYDKLVSALTMRTLQQLVTGDAPSRLNSDEAWRHWLNARDIELLDLGTQLSLGELDGEVAGKRVSDNVRLAIALKYSTRAVFRNRASSLFRPQIVGAPTS